MSDAYGADGLLDGVVAQAVAERLPLPDRVQSVSRETSPFSRRSPAEIVTITLEDGAVVRLFVKYLRPEHAEHPDKRRRDREPLVYRQLLGTGELPVPRFFGEQWDARSRRHVLVLEHVDDWPLKYHGLEHWATAAREVARLHSAFGSRRGELRRADFLLRLDRGYFAAWAARALVAVRALSVALEDRLQRALRDHSAVTRLLADQPATLVHNDLAPKNVVVDTSMAPARVCLVDWELAGVGCGAIDLAHLMHGLSAEDREAVASAYWSMMARPTRRTARDRDRLLSACDLHNAVFRLAHIHAWGIDREAVEEWVDEIARLRTAVGAG